MSVLVPNLEKMSVKEKLQAIEEIWSSMSDVDRDSFETPEWHLDLLREREERYNAGVEKPIPWEDAKRQLRESIAKRSSK